MPEDRAQHLQWCKDRALECVDRGDLVNALASFLTDMGHHPETDEYMRSPAIAMLFAMEGIYAVEHDDRRAMRRLIDGCQ